MLRNPFSVDILVSNCSGSCRSSSGLGESWNCWPFAQQRTQGPVAWPGDWTLRDRAGADNLQDFSYLDCEGIKVQGLPCSESFVRGTSSSCCYIVIASQFIFFKELDIRDSAMGDLGLIRWGNLVWLCECGSVAAKRPQSQLRWVTVTARVAPAELYREVSLISKRSVNT